MLQMVLQPLRLESYSTDEQTATRIDVGKAIPRHLRVCVLGGGGGMNIAH